MILLYSSADKPNNSFLRTCWHLSVEHKGNVPTGEWPFDLSAIDIGLTYCSQTGNHEGGTVAVPASYFTQQHVAPCLTGKLCVRVLATDSVFYQDTKEDTEKSGGFISMDS